MWIPKFFKLNQSVADIKSDFNRIEDDNSCINQEVIRLDYLCHLDQLNMKNIPEDKSENLYDIFELIAIELGVPKELDPRSWINSIFRFGKETVSTNNQQNISIFNYSKPRPRVIVVKFNLIFDFRRIIFYNGINFLGVN